MNPIKFEVTLDIDNYLVRFHGQNIEGDDIVSPQTLEDVVIAEAARQVVAGLDKEVRDHLAHRVKLLRDEIIRDEIIPLVSNAIASPFHRTNTFGEATGATTTLRETIVEAAKSWLTQANRDRSSSSGTLTNVQVIIRDEVAKVLTNEMRAEVEKAKAEVRAAVQEQGAAILAATIVAMAGERQS